MSLSKSLEVRMANFYTAYGLGGLLTDATLGLAYLATSESLPYESHVIVCASIAVHGALSLMSLVMTGFGDDTFKAYKDMRKYIDKGRCYNIVGGEYKLQTGMEKLLNLYGHTYCYRQGYLKAAREISPDLEAAFLKAMPEKAFGICFKP